MKLYEAKFKGMNPVPSGLIILADNRRQATKIAMETVTHTEIEGIIEIKIDKPKVVFYRSGDY